MAAYPPHLRLTLAAKRNAAKVAAALGVHPGVIVWGLMELWEHVWERRTDSSVGALALAGCFGPGAEVVAALVAFGFLRELPDAAAWHVCGAEQYLLISAGRAAGGEARAASADRGRGGQFRANGASSNVEHSRTASPASASKPPATDQHTTSSGPAITPNTQHPTPTTKEDLRRSRAAPSATAAFALEPTSADKPPAARSEAQEFWDAAQAERTRTLGLIPEAEPDPPKLNAWFKRAVGVCGVERLWSAYARYLLQPRDAHWRDRGFPFAGFMADNVWRGYVPAEEKRA